jgi:hypothetical protein
VARSLKTVGFRPGPYRLPGRQHGKAEVDRAGGQRPLSDAVIRSPILQTEAGLSRGVPHRIAKE